MEPSTALKGLQFLCGGHLHVMTTIHASMASVPKTSFGVSVRHRSIADLAQPETTDGAFLIVILWMVNRTPHLHCFFPSCSKAYLGFRIFLPTLATLKD